MAAFTFGADGTYSTLYDALAANMGGGNFTESHDFYQRGSTTENGTFQFQTVVDNGGYSCSVYGDGSTIDFNGNTALYYGSGGAEAVYAITFSAVVFSGCANFANMFGNGFGEIIITRCSGSVTGDAIRLGDATSAHHLFFTYNRMDCGGKFINYLHTSGAWPLDEFVVENNYIASPAPFYATTEVHELKMKRNYVDTAETDFYVTHFYNNSNGFIASTYTNSATTDVTNNNIIWADNVHNTDTLSPLYNVPVEGLLLDNDGVSHDTSTGGFYPHTGLNGLTRGIRVVGPYSRPWDYILAPSDLLTNRVGDDIVLTWELNTSLGYERTYIYFSEYPLQGSFQTPIRILEFGVTTVSIPVSELGTIPIAYFDARHGV